jgi:hypothetical protein
MGDGITQRIRLRQQTDLFATQYRPARYARLSLRSPQAGAILSIFAVLGMVEDSQASIPIAAENETVFVFRAENVVINHATIKPEIHLTPNDAFGLELFQSLCVTSKLGSLFTGVNDSVSLGGKADDRQVASQSLIPCWRTKPVCDISTNCLHDRGRFAVVGKKELNGNRLRENIILLEPRVAIRLQNVVNVVIDDLNEQMGPFGLGQSIGRLVGSLGRLFGSLNRPNKISALLVGGTSKSGRFSEQSGGFPGKHAGKDSYQEIGQFDFEKAGKPILICCVVIAVIGGVRLVSKNGTGWRYRLGVALCFIGPLGLVCAWAFV